jgi:hypothetical protein
MNGSYNLNLYVRGQLLIKVIFSGSLKCPLYKRLIPHVNTLVNNNKKVILYLSSQ